MRVLERIIPLSAIGFTLLFLRPAFADETQPAPPKPDFAANDAHWIYDAKSNCWTHQYATDPTGQFTWTGGCTDNRISGRGTLIITYADKNSIALTGEFEKGVLNGKGYATWADGGHVRGTFKDGMVDGFAEETWASGDHYTGEYKDGMFDGHGTLFNYPDTHYEGGFRKGKYDGQGVMKGPSRAHFTGEYRLGRPYNGSGLLTHSDHSSFEGTLKDGKPEGPGKSRFAGGGSYDGNFHNGYFEGQGDYVGPDGAHYVGGFAHSAPEGHGVLTFISGVYEGEFHGPGMSGHGVLRKPDGTTLEGDVVQAHEDPDNPSDPVQYPPISRRLAEEGPVLVVFTIQANGQVSDVKVVQSSGYQRLDEYAKSVVEAQHYIPAKIGGVAVAITKDRYYNFRLEPPLPR